MISHRRTADERVARVTAFATRVSELSPSEWTRIEARCVALSDASFSALLARAALTAKAHQLWVPAGAKRSLKLRVLKTVSDAIDHGFAFAIEVLSEFDATAEPGVRSSGRSGTAHRRTRATSPRVDALVEAHRRLEAVLIPRMRQHP
jgi:hypothetical protein